jgi:hypothetical protein
MALDTALEMLETIPSEEPTLAGAIPVWLTPIIIEAITILIKHLLEKIK